jgi:hypothetical protein
MELVMNYCVMCGVSWNPWGEKQEPKKCWSCGFDSDCITRMSGPKIEIVPESCPDHPKYKAIGKPSSDCPTCWLMYRYVVDKKTNIVNSKDQ